MALKISSTNVVNDDRSVTLGTATPGSPITGMVRYNSSLVQFEVYDGAAWVNIISTGTPDILYAWGLATNGRLGDNTTVNKSSPVIVVGGFTDWTQVSAGYHSTALRANGTAWAWGRGNFGQIGDNTTVDKSSPVSVVGGFTDWTKISAGTYHSLALRANGTAWAWGLGNNGRLGDNTTVNKSSPVSVVGGFTDWIQVSAGNIHSLALRADGSAWGWGSGSQGRLGNNSTAGTSSPVSVVGGFTDWVQVSANYHSLALRANGTAWAWGRGDSGQLGDNTAVSKSSPVSVVGGFTDWVQVSSGYTHSVAVRANGTVWAWGSAGKGQLGDNSIINKSSPVSIVGGFTDWVQSSASGGNVSNQSAATRANGTIWTWGSGNDGLLGNNSTVSRSSPVSVVGGFTDWVSCAVGKRHMLALRA